MLIKQNQLVINGTTLEQSDLQAIANVASDVQAQIDTKAPINNAQFTGNVGIGTSSPDAPLDVTRVGDGTIAMFQNTGNHGFEFSAPSSTALQIASRQGSKNLDLWANTLSFSAGGSERIRIDAGGILNVTSGGAPIIPTIKHSGIDPYLAKIRLINRSGQYIDKGGLVELGGITNDEVTRTDVFASVAGLKATTASNNRTGYMQFSVNDGSALTERMRITSSGNVGIGTDSPLSSPAGAFAWANPIATIEGSRPTLYLNGSGSLATIRMWPSGTDGSSTSIDDFHINAIATSGSTPGSLSFAAQGGAIGSGLSINSNNIVTTPDQPGFWVRLNGDQTGYNPGYYNHSVIFNYKQFDVGNNVDTTTGLFTAPVDGVYIFFASAYSQANTFNQAWFTVNGGRGLGSDFVKASADSFVNCSITFKLSANDTVGYHPYGSGSNVTIKANENHTWFRGHLIG